MSERCFNFPQLKDLHKLGADLSMQDPSGQTLLHHAADVGCKEIVKYIIENGTSSCVQRAKGPPSIVNDQVYFSGRPKTIFYMVSSNITN